MSDCHVCDVEHRCFYEYKPCECVQRRKFKSLDEMMKEFEGRVVDAILIDEVRNRIKSSMLKREYLLRVDNNEITIRIIPS